MYELMDRAAGAEMLDVAPFRDAVLEALRRPDNDLTWYELCGRLGWVASNGRRETSRLQRRLGLMREWGGRFPDGSVKPPEFRKRISYENAVAVVRAIDADPVDFDI